MRWKKSCLPMLVALCGLAMPLFAQERLSLDQCIAIVTRESETLRSAAVSKEAAQFDADATFWNYFPTASISVNYLKLYFEPEPEKIEIPSIPGVTDGLSGAFDIPEWNRTLDITVAQPVTPLWSVWKGHDAKRLAAEIAAFKQQATTAQIAAQTAEYFYSYLMLERFEALIAESEKQLDRYAAQAQNFVDAGLTDKRAVLKVSIEKAKLAKEKEQVRGNKALVRRALALLMNRAEESFELEYHEADLVPLAIDRTELTALQKKNRPELRMLERLDRIADDLSDIAVQPLVPTVALTGGYRHNFDSSLVSPEGTFFVGAVLSWNFGFDTLKNIAAYRKARSEKTATLLANIDARKQMDLQLSSLHSDLMVKEKEIAIAQASIEAAAENLRIEEAKYQEKMTTETDLLAANLQERQAKTSYITAVFQYKIALWKLAAVIGVPVERLTGASNKGGER